jgi:uncharacterized phage-associated protein
MEAKINRSNIEDVATFVLAYFENNGKTISHLKLQKILYYIQSWHLAYFHDPLFKDEPEAWINGPVYIPIYDRYNTTLMMDPIKIDHGRTTEDFFNSACEKVNFTNDQQELISSVLHKYGAMPQLKLVYLTHKERPWNDARQGIAPFVRSRNTITHKSMEEYYSGLVSNQ